MESPDGFPILVSLIVFLIVALPILFARWIFRIKRREAQADEMIALLKTNLSETQRMRTALESLIRQTSD